MSWTFPVENKIIVVTGGGSGIGLSYTILAAKQGAQAILIADINLTEDAKLAIKDHDQIEFIHCDVTKWGDLQNLIHVSIDKFGNVPDVYVASAGVFEPARSPDPLCLERQLLALEKIMHRPPESNRYKHVDINVNHPIKLTRLAIRALLSRNRQGVVAIISSIAGYSKQYPAPIYSATKHVIVGFTRSLGPAQELQGVKVVCICPGIVMTPLWTIGTPGSGEGRTEGVPPIAIINDGGHVARTIRAK